MFHTQASIEAKRYRLELILFGYVLASNESRSKAFSRINPSGIANIQLRDCFEAVAAKDKDTLMSHLAAFEVDPASDQEWTIDAIIDRIIEFRQEVDLKYAIAAAMASNSVDDLATIKRKLNTALEMVDRHEKELTK